MHEFLNDWLGLDVSVMALTWTQLCARTVVVFAFGLLLVRLADRRFLGRNAGFDVVLAIVLGSVVSRAINGQAAFFPTLGAGFVLVLLHRLLAIVSCRSHVVSRLLKGSDCLLIRDGQIDRVALRRAEFSEDDLLENLRLRGNVASAEDVAEARLERNGQISVVLKSR